MLKTVGKEDSDTRGRRGCCAPAVGRGRTAWDEVGKVLKVAEEGSNARVSEGCCEPAIGRGRTAWDEVG